ncbi:cytochrome-c peroxidase [Pseudobdellovibrio sp. HCB154]|uniref:cytochrome-c peroxidase n=1 Tax=Pseudobdellovibrio sp. HCB154 TaxID=3386277 RepID=UPI0039176104
MKKIVILFFIAVTTHAIEKNSEPIRPLPLNLKDNNPEKMQLGFLLFNEKKLSANNTISCASCHALNAFGVDGLAKSVGIHGGIGSINAPTVFNSGLNFVQFWNGRAKTLEEQIDGPLLHPKEMGNSWAQAVAKLNQDKKYREAFSAIYRDGITVANVKNAIADFERKLTTPNSKFDRYLRGEKTLSELEENGYKRFKSLGCISCHQGQNIGGNMFQTMGVMGNYFKDRKDMPQTEDDLGRYLVTKRDRDKFVFRVPSLRNVEMTAPYFHDGYAKTLDQAVDIMGRYQLGQKLSQRDITSIVVFLKTLTGETPSVLKKVEK